MGGARKKKSGLPAIIAVIVLAVAAFVLFKVFGPNLGMQQYLYIHTGSTYDQLAADLKATNFLGDMTIFGLLAKAADLPAHVHAGRYQLKRGMSTYNVIRMLRSGRQSDVRLVITKLRTRQDFINLVSANLEVDSNELRKMLQDPVYLKQFGLDTNTVMCAVIPDSYFFHWNTNANKAFRKIHENYTRFWTESRREEAKKQGLTPVSTTIMASIIDEETNKLEDKPNIASVYLNRLQKGMKLQADPTVKFAIGDFAIKRITGVMLETKSPYNTYQNEGLPPGPICTPAPSSIDAVLQAPKTNYIYFCAKADLSGASVFAATSDEHIKNARLYQKALNERGIH